MKIIVAQFYTSNVKYGKYSEKINREYCKNKGYEYVVEKNDSKIYSLLQDRAPTWYKPQLIQEIFDKSNLDWVLFLDADAIISDDTQKIEDYIDSKYELIVSDDVGHHSDYNAGVILIKNSKWSREFIKTWWTSSNSFTGIDAKELAISSINSENINVKGIFKTALWHDQTCLTLLGRLPENKNNIKVIDRHLFNHDQYGEGNFIFHAYAKGLYPYRTLDIVYNTLYNKDLNKKNINLIVYHIYAVGNYLEVANRQINRLVSSGIYEWSDLIEVTCCKPDGRFEDIEKLISQHTKIKLNKITENNYEYPAINKIWEYSQEYNGKVLYLHAKGVSNTYENLNTNKLSKRKVKGISIWTEVMEYFLIDRYKECLEKLNTYDQVGVTNVNDWWWGNFWWANLDNISVQSKPDKGDRWYFEAWINMGRKSRYYEFYNFTWNPYLTDLPLEFYTGKKYNKVEIKNATYGTTGIQVNEGKEYVERDVVHVSPIIRKMFDDTNGKLLKIKVTNEELGGDPKWGYEKHLEVTVILENKEYIITVDENNELKVNFNE